MDSCAVILLAAGASRRFVAETNATCKTSKPFVTLAGKPLWRHSLDKFRHNKIIAQRIIVVPPALEAQFRREEQSIINAEQLDVIGGGAERYDSVTRALSILRDDITLVAIHDTARPCVCRDDIDAVLVAASNSRDRAAMLAAPIVGTIKRANTDNIITATLSRDNLWEAQTPQVFDRVLIERAYTERGDFRLTDDSQLVERLGISVQLVASPRTNLKVTTAEDLALVEAILAGERLQQP